MLVTATSGGAAAWIAVEVDGPTDVRTLPRYAGANPVDLRHLAAAELGRYLAALLEAPRPAAIEVRYRAGGGRVRLAVLARVDGTGDPAEVGAAGAALVDRLAALPGTLRGHPVVDEREMMTWLYAGAGTRVTELVRPVLPLDGPGLAHVAPPPVPGTRLLDRLAHSPEPTVYTVGLRPLTLLPGFAEDLARLADQHRRYAVPEDRPGAGGLMGGGRRLAVPLAAEAADRYDRAASAYPAGVFLLRAAVSGPPTAVAAVAEALGLRAVPAPDLAAEFPALGVRQVPRTYPELVARLADPEELVAWCPAPLGQTAGFPPPPPVPAVAIGAGPAGPISLPLDALRPVTAVRVVNGGDVRGAVTALVDGLWTRFGVASCVLDLAGSGLRGMLPDLRVLALREDLTPWRLNPLEPPAGREPSTHDADLAGLLATVFGTGPATVPVLASVLEGLRARPRLLVPGLRDLITALDDVRLATVRDALAALAHRPAGAVLTATRSLPAAVWAARPVLVELAEAGPETDRTLLAELITSWLRPTGTPVITVGGPPAPAAALTITVNGDGATLDGAGWPRLPFRPPPATAPPDLPNGELAARFASDGDLVTHAMPYPECAGCRHVCAFRPAAAAAAGRTPVAEIRELLAAYPVADPAGAAGWWDRLLGLASAAMPAHGAAQPEAVADRAACVALHLARHAGTPWPAWVRQTRLLAAALPVG
ncbi:MAG: hypothetical protein ACJ73S_27000 [Mycobacteriales bacterium]